MKLMNKKWDLRFLELAELISKWSKDPSTKVGAVIVGIDREIRSTGFNGFPRGVKDDDRYHDRHAKYPIICHAEENAIMHAARIGVSVKDCVIYTTMVPCPRCARGIIQAGLDKVVVPAVEIPDRWVKECSIAIDLLKEGEVGVYTAYGSLY